MSPEDEQRLTAWIDGEIGDEEIADLLAAHPGLAEEKQRAAELGSMLRREFGDEGEGGADIPYGDFFTHSVRRRIDDGDLGATHADDDEDDDAVAYQGLSLREEAAVLPVLTRTRYAAGIAFLLLLAGVLGQAFLTAPPAATGTGSEVLRMTTAGPAIIATSRYSEEAEATIIELKGLDEVPAGDAEASPAP